MNNGNKYPPGYVPLTHHELPGHNGRDDHRRSEGPRPRSSRFSSEGNGNTGGREDQGAFDDNGGGNTSDPSKRRRSGSSRNNSGRRGGSSHKSSSRGSKRPA